MNTPAIALAALITLPAFAADSHEKACARLNHKMNKLAESAEKNDLCKEETSKACRKHMEKVNKLFAEAEKLGECDFDVLDKDD